jgi:hypothetical protein
MSTLLRPPNVREPRYARADEAEVSAVMAPLLRQARELGCLRAELDIAKLALIAAEPVSIGWAWARLLVARYDCESRHDESPSQGVSIWLNDPKNRALVARADEPIRGELVLLDLE